MLFGTLCRLGYCKLAVNARIASWRCIIETIRLVTGKNERRETVWHTGAATAAERLHEFGERAGFVSTLGWTLGRGPCQVRSRPRDTRNWD